MERLIKKVFVLVPIYLMTIGLGFSQTTIINNGQEYSLTRSSLGIPLNIDFNLRSNVTNIGGVEISNMEVILEKNTVFQYDNRGAIIGSTLTFKPKVYVTRMLTTRTGTTVTVRVPLGNYGTRENPWISPNFESFEIEGGNIYYATSLGAIVPIPYKILIEQWIPRTVSPAPNPIPRGPGRGRN